MISNNSTYELEILKLILLKEPPCIIGIILTTSLFFNLVNGPSIAEESIPLIATSKFFTSSLLSLLGLFVTRKSKSCSMLRSVFSIIRLSTENDF